jgi:prepilin signal peptidase PulO-like enzyme (type II secretory pathway)
MKWFGAGRELKLGPYMAAGFAAAAMFGDSLTAAYLSLYQ